MILALSIVGILIAIVPAGMFLANLPLFTLSTKDLACDPGSTTSVSVLIPARDEAGGIANSIEAALASRQVDVEVVVLDDHSTDDTAEIVKRISESDSRVRYVLGATLRSGWNGKQYACKQLADTASHERLLFLDADVRLQPEALATLLARQDTTDVALLSAFPHQETGTVLEKLIIPMMHFILLCFLPLARMRASNQPAYAAGCGQLFLTRRELYRQAGTHEALCESRHDGLKLPRVYRAAGLMTDVVDGTSIADCRMYRSAGEVIRGVLKNANEGIADPRLIVPFSVLLLGGSVLPVVTLVWSIVAQSPLAIAFSIVGVMMGHLPRAIAAIRFRQSWLGVVCHSLATLIFVALQWVALAIHLLGRQIAWRGRTET
jgi:glycosyltransferase involved in cell wall biosynthesis